MARRRRRSSAYAYDNPPAPMSPGAMAGLIALGVAAVGGAAVVAKSAATAKAAAAAKPATTSLPFAQALANATRDLQVAAATSSSSLVTPTDWITIGWGATQLVNWQNAALPIGTVAAFVNAAAAYKTSGAWATTTTGNQNNLQTALNLADSLVALSLIQKPLPPSP